MSNWSQMLLQDSFSPLMQILSLFHDYSLTIIGAILCTVVSMSHFMLKNQMISDSVLSSTVEVVWTILPVFMLLLMAIPSLQILYYMEECDPYLTLKVTGHQWYWSYEYMDLDLEFDSYMLPSSETGEFRLLETDNQVILPVYKDIRTLITAADVLHSWAVPSLGVKADAVPGRLNQVFFSFHSLGAAYGQCSEICGANHSFMPISIEAHPMNKFHSWVSSQMVN